MEHCIKATVLGCRYEQQSCVVVVFQTKDEIDNLISALNKLKSSSNREQSHFHLQDFNLKLGSSAPYGEITFISAPYGKNLSVLENWGFF